MRRLGDLERTGERRTRMRTLDLVVVMTMGKIKEKEMNINDDGKGKDPAAGGRKVHLLMRRTNVLEEPERAGV